MTHAHGAEPSTKEIVVIIEEVSKWILAPEKLSEYLIGALHVEMLEIWPTATEA